MPGQDETRVCDQTDAQPSWLRMGVHGWTLGDGANRQLPDEGLNSELKELLDSIGIELDDVKHVIKE